MGRAMVPSSRTLAVTAVCLALAASAAAAPGVRTDLLPHPGTLVRATVSANGETVRAVGVLVEASDAGLVLRRERGRHLYHVPGAVLLGLEVGLSRNHGRGAGLGMIYGALGTGLFVGTAAALSADGSNGYWTAAESFQLGAALGGALGAALGLVLGGLIGTEEWRRVW